MKNKLPACLLLIVFLISFHILLLAQSKLDSLLPVRGLCINIPRTQGLASFVHFINTELVPRKVNTLLLLVDYHYQFATHPELEDSFALSKTDVKKIVITCR